MKATLVDRLVHIRDAAAQITRLVSEYSDEAFASDALLRAALERFFEIVSEASRYIPEGKRREHADVPWRSVADLGNRLRHGYEGVDLATLLQIARRQLPDLADAIESIIASADERDHLEPAQRRP